MLPVTPRPHIFHKYPRFGTASPTIPIYLQKKKFPKVPFKLPSVPGTRRPTTGGGPRKYFTTMPRPLVTKKSPLNRRSQLKRTTFFKSTTHRYRMKTKAKLTTRPSRRKQFFPTSFHHLTQNVTASPDDDVTTTANTTASNTSASDDTTYPEDSTESSTMRGSPKTNRNFNESRLVSPLKRPTTKKSRSMMSLKPSYRQLQPTPKMYLFTSGLFGPGTQIFPTGLPSGPRANKVPLLQRSSPAVLLTIIGTHKRDPFFAHLSLLKYLGSKMTEPKGRRFFPKQFSRLQTKTNTDGATASNTTLTGINNNSNNNNSSSSINNNSSNNNNNKTAPNVTTTTTTTVSTKESSNVTMVKSDSSNDYLYPSYD